MDIKNYCENLTNRIFKILPLREENPENAKKYVSSLVVELQGACSLFEENDYLTRILCSIKGIEGVTDYNVVRRKVFECLDLINKITKEE
jgi:hypothetical protein